MSTKQTREATGLSQSEAARRAGVSLATWRRWEEDGSRVRAETAARCRRVLEARQGRVEPIDVDIAHTNAVWGTSNRMTPRQAFMIMRTLDLWGDLTIGEWLQDPDEPLHEIDPFSYFDKRVMMLVGESRAWAAMAKERCHAVAGEIRIGILPFDRPGCYLDEVLMGAALQEAQDTLNGSHDFLEGIIVREPAEGLDLASDEDPPLFDDDWDMVADLFDDEAEWDDWEVPLWRDHPVLAPLLERRHPFRWFDVDGPRPRITETFGRESG